LGMIEKEEELRESEELQKSKKGKKRAIDEAQKIERNATPVDSGSAKRPSKKKKTAAK